MSDVFFKTLADLVLDSRRPSVVGSIRGRFFVVDAFACLLNALRGGINQIFGVGNLLFDQFEFTFNSLSRSLAEFMIVNNPGSLVKGRLGSSAFPMIGQLHSLTACVRNHLIPQGCG